MNLLRRFLFLFIISLKLATAVLLLLLAGCGSKAIYEPTGAVCIAEQNFTIKATVPDKDGKLVTGVTTTFGVGSQIKGK